MNMESIENNLEEIPDVTPEIQTVVPDSEGGDCEKGKLKNDLGIEDDDDFLNKEKDLDEGRERPKLPHNGDGDTLN